MIIAAGLKQLFDKYNIAYRALQHKRVSNIETAALILNINLNNVLKVQVLADNDGEVLVVYPVGRKVDLSLCQVALKRPLQLLPSIEVNRIFKDCEADAWTAVGQPYNLDIILDRSIKELEEVYFSSGSHTTILNMHITDYLVLNPRAKFMPLTVEAEQTENQNESANEMPDLSNLNFPPLPAAAMQLIQLSMSKDHSTQELAELIAQDPAIQQQVMFYLQMPFMQEKLQANPESHLLNFDMVSHIAVGFAAGRAFNQESIHELEEFWRHAFYAATYAGRITELLAERLDLDPAISYMAGLFHNFGLLLISQMFAPEYALLKKWMALNPKVSIAILERRLLGMGEALNILRGGHAQLGEWLLRSWKMPEAICVITKEHHSLTYKGKYANYVRIIQLTNQLLRDEGIGDGTIGGIAEQLLEPLGLAAQEVYQCIDPIKASAAGLDNMARSLTKS